MVLDTIIPELKNEWVKHVKELIRLWKFHKGMNYDELLDSDDIKDFLNTIEETIIYIQNEL